MYGVCGVFIANTLDPEGKCQKKLTKFLKNIDVYFHPSNRGDWCSLLGLFITSISFHFSERLKNERTTNVVPESFKLTQKNIDDFVLSLMDVIKLAQFSKSESLFDSVSYAVNRLALIRPEIVVPTLMEYIIPGLETVTETHQTTHALELLTAMGRVLSSKYLSIITTKIHVIH